MYFAASRKGKRPKLRREKEPFAEKMEEALSNAHYFTDYLLSWGTWNYFTDYLLS